MSQQIMEIRTPEDCVSVLNDVSYKVPHYGNFFEGLEQATGFSFCYLKQVFSQNLFALSGAPHKQLKGLMLKGLSKAQIDEAMPDIGKNICDEMQHWQCGTIVNFYPLLERLGYNALYTFLGVDKAQHQQILTSLNALRRVINTQEPLKIKDYRAIESQLATLFTIIRNSKANKARSFYRTMMPYFTDKNDLAAIIVVLIAGSGAMVDTLANMLAFMLTLNGQQRDELFNGETNLSAIERLLFHCGGVKHVYRECPYSGRVIKLDLDAASKSTCSEEQLVSGLRLPAKYNLAFGAGEHRCIGEMLSRKIMNIVITQFIVQFPGAILVDGNDGQFHLFSERKHLMCRL